MSINGLLIGKVVVVATLTGLVTYCIGALSPKPEQPAALPATCANGPARLTLATAHNPTLKKLAEYELLCKGSATNTAMIFAPMPTNEAEAHSYSTTVTKALKEFAAHHISPLVVFEPSFSSPTIMSEIKNGSHDQAFKTYFSLLKEAGIKQEQMGTWVLFPEANTPIWHNTNPEDFTVNITKVSGHLKAAFPLAKTSILLNTWTYPSDDTDWGNGELKSLKAYVKNLPPGSIDSVGLQGFPYKSPANAPAASRLEIRDFLPAHLVKEMANVTKKQQVWLNTGTFSRMYAGDQAAEVHLSPEERGAILTKIVEEARTLQKANLTVLVNIFAEDKSTVGERVDWSYWPSSSPATGADAEQLSTFLKQLRHHNIDVSLYDAAK